MMLYLSQKRLLILLLSAWVLGFLLAVLYDFFRLFRRHRRPKKRLGKFLDGLLISLEDFLFFVFCGIVASILFYVTNSGKVRFSAFVVGGFGFAFCRVTLSRFLLSFLDWLIGRVRAGFAFMAKKILLPPLSALARLAGRFIGALSLKRRRRKTEKLLKKLRTMGQRGYAEGLRRL